jgi:hypothetical protein
MPLALIAAFLLSATGEPVAARQVPQYTLHYDAGSEMLAVRLCLPNAAASVHFSADDEAPKYVEGLSRDHAPAPTRDDEGWLATDWRAGECLAYRAALGRIVDSGHRSGGARHGKSLVLDPTLWLLRVDAIDDAAEARVELPAGFSISAPWHPLPSTDGTKRFTIPRTPDDWLARVAIGRFDEKPMAIAGGTLRVSIVDGADTATRSKLETWLAHVSRAAISAYGKLPLADVQLLIVPVPAEREPVVFGQSTRGEGHGVTLFIDAAQSATAFDRDWVAVHELSHLFHPYLGDRGSWLAEGLATYYQNVLRARAGLLTPAEAWEQIDAGFSRGRRATRNGDVTLQRTAENESEHPNFMRIYWAGTAFWLETDMELRRTSGNRLSVDEAMRRFDACCLPSYRAWRPDEFVDKLDALLGTGVFHKHFVEFRDAHAFPDLAPVYRELGITRAGDTLSYNDDASAADVRRAIMTPAPRSE